ncbi:hypothetical protein M8C21_014411, partial [Ambrosia artemisiifolia]
QGTEDSLVLMRDGNEERVVEAIALGLGMRKVGFIFTQTVGQGKRDYTFSNREVLQAVEIQGESELKEWVKVVVKLEFETEVAKGDDPKLSKMKKDVVVGGKDTREVDNDFFLVVVKIFDHQRTTMVLTNQRPESIDMRLECTPQHLVRLLPIIVDENCFKFNAPATALEIDQLRIGILGLKLQVLPSSSAPQATDGQSEVRLWLLLTSGTNLLMKKSRDYDWFGAFYFRLDFFDVFVISSTSSCSLVQ